MILFLRDLLDNFDGVDIYFKDNQDKKMYKNKKCMTDRAKMIF